MTDIQVAIAFGAFVVGVAGLWVAFGPAVALGVGGLVWFHSAAGRR